MHVKPTITAALKKFGSHIVRLTLLAAIAISCGQPVFGSGLSGEITGLGSAREDVSLYIGYKRGLPKSYFFWRTEEPGFDHRPENTVELGALETRFSIRDLAGGDYSVYAWSSNGDFSVTGVKDLGEGEVRDNIRLDFAQNIEIVGNVADNEAQGVGGSFLSVGPMTDNHNPHNLSGVRELSLVQSDVDGNFRLAIPPEYGPLVSAYHPDRGSGWFEVGTGLDLQTVKIVLQPFTSLRGKLTVDGEPVSDEIVFLDYKSSSGRAALIRSATTGSDGEYEFRGIPSGTPELSFWVFSKPDEGEMRERGVRKTITLVPTSEQVHDIILESGLASISGSVLVDSQIEQGVVSILNRNSTTGEFVFVHAPIQADGSFTIEFLITPSTVLLAAKVNTREEGVLRLHGSKSLTDPERVTVELVAPSDGLSTLSGKFRLFDADDVASIAVYRGDVSGSVFSDMKELAVRLAGEGRADSDGNFAIRKLPIGTYTVVATVVSTSTGRTALEPRTYRKRVELSLDDRWHAIDEEFERIN